MASLALLTVLVKGLSSALSRPICRRVSRKLEWLSSGLPVKVDFAYHVFKERAYSLGQAHEVRGAASTRCSG